MVIIRIMIMSVIKMVMDIDPETSMLETAAGLMAETSMLLSWLRPTSMLVSWLGAACWSHG